MRTHTQQMNVRNNLTRLIQIHLMWAFAMSVLTVSVMLRAADDNPPSSAFKLYNDGTRKLRDGKLQEADACLQAAVSSQKQEIQPAALYNLGEVRFKEGDEERKKSPNAEKTTAAASQAASSGGEAIKSVDDALASEDAQKMISAYLQGRGARKELKAATDAVKRAMETSGSVLEKWRRAEGDFKGSYELLPANSGARTNAEIVDRWIAFLVDQQRQMMQAMMGMQGQRGELGKKMAALKKKLPPNAGDQMKGKSGDEDDEDENGGKPKLPEGEEKIGQKEGKEMQLTSEEASRMLDGLKLDGNRKLPMGTKDEGKPADRKGRDW